MLNDHPNAKVQLALHELSSGNTGTSIVMLRGACNDIPGDAVPHFLLGAALAQTGELDEAESSFAKALLLSPQLMVCRFQLGLLQLTRGRAAIALLTWAPLLELPTENPIRHYVMGYSTMAADDFQGALQHFEAGLQLPQENEALSDDIRRTIAKIESMPISSAQIGQINGNSSASDSNHFLVANYANPGNQH